MEAQENGGNVDYYEIRQWDDLRTHGLLWLINRAVFHPRGYALGFVMDADTPIGWTISGDGSEPWQYASEVDERELFEKVQAFFASLGGEQ